MTKRAAIYARFSSDLQRDTSIEDQVASCRRYAAHNDYAVVATFDDRAQTGASLHNRPGILALMDAARAGEFDAVITESLSRLARDEEDSPHIRKRLDFVGVAIVTVADGLVTPLVHGLRTIIDGQYLDDLKRMTRRGMDGVVRDGRHPGGRAYGYRPIAGSPGQLEIVDAEAATVRRIFERYVAGDSPREIAAALNAERIQPPRGKYWRASTINGNSKRSNGILQNELYAGVIVWNRVRMMRDPDTGKRISKPNPASEWRRAEAPHLRIVPDELFQRTRERKLGHASQSTRDHRKPRRFLSGLFRCGHCGAGMSACGPASRPRLVCTKMRESGSCINRRYYDLRDVESRVVGGLREQLGSREAIDYFVRVYNDEKQRASAAAYADRAQLERRLAAAQREIDRTVALVIKQVITEAEASVSLPALREEAAQLSADLDAIGADPKVVTLNRPAVDDYLRGIEQLTDLVNGDVAEGDMGLAHVIRDLVETVTVVPVPAGMKPPLNISGTLAALVPDEVLSNTRNMPGLTVAGAGLEPATSGL